MNKLYIGTMTMNFGKDISGSILFHNLKNTFKDFNIIVADGNLTKEAEEKYKQFSNVKVLNSPWQDSHIKQYQKIYDQLNEGDWLLYLDDDEMMSSMLIDYLTRIDFSAPLNFGQQMHLLPCVLFLTEDGVHYYPVEEAPPLQYKEGMWTKQILIRKCSNIYLESEGSHVQFKLKNWEKAAYTPYPYFHFRTLESFIDHDCWQMFLSPRGQGFTKIEEAQFKPLIKQFKTMKEFREATRAGKWPISLQKFAYDNRNIYDRPISRLYMLYHVLLGHPCFKDDTTLTKDNIKQYIQSEKVLKLYEYNKQNKIGEIIIEKDF